MDGSELLFRYRRNMEMYLVEPCCSQKHLRLLRKSLGEDGTALFHGYGDLSLNELLPPLLTSCSETHLLIATPYLPDLIAETLLKWMRKQWVQMDGKGKENVIAHLTLITDLSEKRSPLASTLVKDNPFGERLTLKNVQQNDTALLLPDLALYGAINLQYGHHFTAIATKNARTIATLRSVYEGLR